MRVSVIGTGYLGAVHAAGMAALGHEVVGVDADPMKIAALASGEAPFYEPDFPVLLRSMIDAGRLRFTTILEEAARDADVNFVCVGTPQREGSDAADTSAVEAVVAGLARHCAADAIIVGKSTVPVGTAARLKCLIATTRSDGPSLAWNPEFLREGFAVEDTLAPDRLILGVDSPRSEVVLREVYASLIDVGTPVVVTDLASAELIKVTANAFLATKISFINAVAQVCEASGADVVAVADGIGHDARIGRRFLNAGVGFGGGCLGKDIRAFSARADELGVASVGQFLRTVDAINDGRRARVVELAYELLEVDDLAGARITVLGAAFKPNSDDVRDSPALAVACRLHELGARVAVHDPEAIENARRAAPQLSYQPSLRVALSGADLLVLLTEWDCYRLLDPSIVSPQVGGLSIIDGRNCLDEAQWRRAGWTYRALGRPSRTVGVRPQDLTSEGVAS